MEAVEEVNTEDGEISLKLQGKAISLDLLHSRANRPQGAVENKATKGIEEEVVEEVKEEENAADTTPKKAKK